MNTTKLRLTDSATPLSRFDIKPHLQVFIRWTLEEICACRYSPLEAMQLIDAAWKAQKLLWQLRQQGL